MERYCEDLISRLKLNKEEVENWYKARHYVLDLMPPLDGKGIRANSSKYVHVLVDKITPLTLAVIRQICLIAHYPNYDEETEKNRTVISICEEQAEVAFEKMKTCPYLGNLLNYCQCTIRGKIEREEDKNLPIDIEFKFIPNNNPKKSEENDYEFIIKSVEIEKAVTGYDKFYMDVTKGMLVNMVYNTGVEIDNLPACDNANIERYSTALNVFCYKLKSEKIRETWLRDTGLKEDDTYGLIAVKNQLSSVFCGDCFASKMRSIVNADVKDMSATIDTLARCEHTRWNVEKLIMGFTPLLQEDWFQLESCFGKERKALVKKFKTDEENPRHIDLCSNKDLRRVNPSDIKYDYFLMLAMPQIMLAVNKIS